MCGLGHTEHGVSSKKLSITKTDSQPEELFSPSESARDASSSSITTGEPSSETSDAASRATSPRHSLTAASFVNHACVTCSCVSLCNAFEFSTASGGPPASPSLLRASSSRSSTSRPECGSTHPEHWMWEAGEHCQLSLRSRMPQVPDETLFRRGPTESNSTTSSCSPITHPALSVTFVHNACGSLPIQGLIWDVGSGNWRAPSEASSDAMSHASVVSLVSLIWSETRAPTSPHCRLAFVGKSIDSAVMCASSQLASTTP
mmetsp:Transcript_3195/g.9322  ORF Transcript_3195/g.9322 Transcript_3195/m.9322 type:complete len:260 (-) Transcript_3195:160-939(-)